MKNPWSLTTAETEVMDFFIVTGCRKGVAKQRDCSTKVVDALRERFPEILEPKSDDICYATQNRQDAVKALAKGANVIFVVGSPSSSNSNRLREVAELRGAKAYLVDHAEQIEPKWLEGATHVGITAGASAPEVLVQQVVEKLAGAHPATVKQLQGVEEHVTFALPKELQPPSA